MNGPLLELLTNLISGGLAAIVVLKLLDTKLGKDAAKAIADALSFTGTTQFNVTRYLAIILSTAVSVGAYCIAMAFGYVEDPVTVEAWANLILTLGGLAFTGSQIAHARSKL